MNMKIIEVNKLNREEFVNIFGNIVECFPKLATKLFVKIPFQDLDNFIQEAHITINGLTITDKETILQLHPDLAGKLADDGKLTNESTHEQQSAGLDTMNLETKKKMNKLNEEYKNKFGFPFVICARENKVESIINGLETRLNNSMQVELQTGINEVKKICKLRILDIIN